MTSSAASVARMPLQYGPQNQWMEPNFQVYCNTGQMRHAPLCTPNNNNNYYHEAHMGGKFVGAPENNNNNYCGTYAVQQHHPTVQDHGSYPAYHHPQRPIHVPNQPPEYFHRGYAQQQISPNVYPPNHQPPLYSQYADYAMLSANSNRVMRNLAEKMRRDKLNTYIGELAALVPMVSSSPKRMDKTSVLRLSATFLRMNHLINGTRQHESNVPQFLNSLNWSQLLLNDMDGVMLIVTSAGKIIFISHNVEKVLGHTQLELFGQSLFNITCPEDHTELKRYLTPDDDDEDGAIGGSDLGYESSSEDTMVVVSSTQMSPCAIPSSSGATNDCFEYDELRRQRRSFYLRLRHRCIARSEQPVYELVHVLGHLRVPVKYDPRTLKNAAAKSKQTGYAEIIPNSNEILLVAVMKPFRERRVTEISMIESSRDEYVTRHLLDGQIIFCDHRISVISGYLSEEVNGLSPFTFMHKEDVRWVLIALRQMYWRGESFGSSCYRLKSRTGEFIYLKTHGYLELNSEMDSYASFICINSLVTQEEGEREIANMKARFSPLIENYVEPGISAIANEQFTIDNGVDTTEDVSELKSAIKAMISDIPAESVQKLKEAPQVCKDSQYVKAKLMSKTLPPVSKKKVDIIVTPKQEYGGAGTSGMTRMPQNRPSVLRIATKPAEIKTEICADGFIKSENVTLDEMIRNGGTVSFSNGGSSVRRNSVALLPSTPLKRTHADAFPVSLDGKRSSLSIDIPMEILDEGATHPPQVVIPSPQDFVASPADFVLPVADISYSLISGPNVANDLENLQALQIPPFSPLRDCSDLLDIDAFETDLQVDNSTSAEMIRMLDSASADLRSGHQRLESRLQEQGVQINRIEDDLLHSTQSALQLNGKKMCIQTDLTHLKEEHDKQQKILFSLSQQQQTLHQPHSHQNFSPPSANGSDGSKGIFKSGI